MRLFIHPYVVDTENHRAAALDLDFIVRIHAIALIADLFISCGNYFPGISSYRPYPIVAFLQDVPVSLNWAVLLACFLAAACMVVRPGLKAPLICILICFAYWIMQDLNRLLAYNYLLCFTLLIVLLGKNNRESCLNALRIMIAGFYFWAGFYKINKSFWLDTAPWFFSPIYEISYLPPYSLADNFAFAIIFITPFLEASIGILMLFSKYRLLGTVLAFLMMLAILLCLGPIGHNTDAGAWPWNVQLFLLDLRLFYGLAHSNNVLPLPRNTLVSFSIILFGIIPAMGIYAQAGAEKIGFKLYSGNRMEAGVFFPHNETFVKLPAHLSTIIKPDQQGNKKWLNINEWQEKEFRAPPYPSVQAYKTGASALCELLDYPEAAQLYISHPAPFYSLQRHFASQRLCN